MRYMRSMCGRPGRMYALRRRSNTKCVDEARGLFGCEVATYENMFIFEWRHRRWSLRFNPPTRDMAGNHDNVVRGCSARVLQIDLGALRGTRLQSRDTSN